MTDYTVAIFSYATVINCNKQNLMECRITLLSSCIDIILKTTLTLLCSMHPVHLEEKVPVRKGGSAGRPTSGLFTHGQ